MNSDTVIRASPQTVRERPLKVEFDEFLREKTRQNSLVIEYYTHK